MQTIRSLGEVQMKTWREYGTITEQDASKLVKLVMLVGQPRTRYVVELELHELHKN